MIFTENEKSNIRRDYLYRLEKIKQKKTKQIKSSLKKPFERPANNLSTILTEGDLIFTEHHIDTREDERDHSELKSKINNFFGKQELDF